jgi:hypothetical protein
MAPLFFEANGDGHPDLYVVAGGATGIAGDERLRDRLLFNDGAGQFRLAPPGSLPDRGQSGSVAVAADFDRDGDLDLFVGGRFIPGQYPLTPHSALLRNQSATFSDVTDAQAPGLRPTGLVTSAVWSDADGDGWLDLLVTCEWGPVKLYHNEQGRLVERTREAGLADGLGWWNGIAAGDLDNDADVDYVVTNFGLNTRYQPTPEQPCRLYYGAFDGGSQPQIIEATVTRAGVLPRRGKSALERVIPSLAARFPTHDSFGSALLPDILGAPALEAAYRLEVNTLESGVLRNGGNGQFTFIPLPRLAQVAPSFGVALPDIDGDGKLDLCLAQNFHGPQRETGRMDGGVGLLLSGKADGTFEPVWPNRSGLVVPGDAKSLAAVDLNNDRWLDLVVAVNQGPLLAFENHVPKTNRLLTVALQGKPGNPTAVGSRVIVERNDGTKQVAEVYAGGGYLSQAPSTLTFGLGTTAQVHQVAVRWPTGRVTLHAARPGDAVLRLTEP